MKITTAPTGILGTGSYLPDRLVSNEEIAGPAGVGAAWIERKTGIRSRYRAAADQAASDLAAEAARRALDAAALDPQELAVIVVATSTSDQPQPATVGFVQDLIGARGAAAVDVNAVCSGFVYALAIAKGLLEAGGTEAAALVIGADLYSRCLDYSDRKTAILIGDGTGAAVLGPVARVEAGGSWLPASDRTVREGGHHFRIEGRAIREFVSGDVPKLVHGMLDDRGLRSDEIRHFVPARVVTCCGAGRVRRPVPNKSRSPKPASRAL